MIEEIKECYSKYKNCVNIVLYVIVVCIVGLCIIFVPELYVKYFYNFDNPDLTKYEINKFNAINSSRTTIIQILAGLMALIGLYLTFRRTKALDKKNEIDEAKYQQDKDAAKDSLVLQQYSKASDLLSSDNIASKLSGIYLFEKIMNNHEEYYWQIIELLTAYVNKYRNIDEYWENDLKNKDNGPYRLDDGRHFKKIPVEQDIQAIITVLGRRNIKFESSTNRIYFRNIYLYGCSFRQGRYSALNRPRFQKLIFDSSVLINTDAIYVDFSESHFYDSRIDDIYTGDTLFDACFFRNTSTSFKNCAMTSFKEAEFENHYFGLLNEFDISQFSDIKSIKNSNFLNIQIEESLRNAFPKKFL